MTTRVQIATPADDQPGQVRMPAPRTGLDGTVLVWRAFAGRLQWVQPAAVGWTRPPDAVPVQPGGMAPTPPAATAYAPAYFAEDYVA